MLITAGMAVWHALPSCMDQKNKLVGIQLWTLRNVVQEEPVKTLEALVKMGYNNIEPYGFDGKFYSLNAREYARIIDDLGARLISTHTNINLENADALSDHAMEAGLEYLVMPSPGNRPKETRDDYKRLADEMNKIGKIVSSRGLRFGYHNHAFEFDPIEGELPYDILLSGTDPEHVCFQMDIFWIIKGGGIPADYFRMYPGRFKLWHVKDMGPDGKSCIIGNGSIDFKKIFKLADLSGMQYFYVEQEEYEKEPVECVEESWQYIWKELV